MRPSNKAFAVLAGLLCVGSVAATCSPSKVGGGGHDGSGGSGGGHAGGTHGGMGNASGNGGGSTGGSGFNAGGFFFDIPDAREASDAGGQGGDKENPLDALEECGYQQFAVKRTPPEVMLVLDRSGSMMHAINGAAPVAMAMQRWSIATTALGSVLTATEDNISWGMKMYPTCKHRAGSGTYDCDFPSGTVNPCAIDGLEWDPMLSQAQVLSGTFAPNVPYIDAGATPTAAAIDSAVAKLMTITTSNPKYLLLVTDGAPNCGVFTSSTDVNVTARCNLLGGVGSRCDSIADDQGSIDAVTRARMAGFPVYVVGFSMDASLIRAHDTLNMMATEGGRPRSDATYKYYLADTGAELQTALNEIAAATISCIFPLPMPPPDDATSEVHVDGKLLPQDATNGWSWGPNKNTVRFNGTACDKLKNGTYMKTEVLHSCPGKPLPEPPPPAE